MKIYKLNLDVDNYQGCFINETNLTKRDFVEAWDSENEKRRT